MMRLLVSATLAALLAFNPGMVHAENATATVNTVDMTTVLKDETGKPARDTLAADDLGKSCVTVDGASQNPAKCPMLTLGRAVEHVLFAQFEEDRQLDPKQKAARADLAGKIVDDHAAKLTAPQVALIETLLGRAYPGLILEQTYKLLDPNVQLPEVK